MAGTDDWIVPEEGHGLDDWIQPPVDQSTIKDMAKSLGMGAVKGFIGSTYALPGNLEEMARAGINKAVQLGTKLAVPAQNTDLLPPAVNPQATMPTSGSVQAGDEAKYGPWYQPQTTAGQYAQTIGEMLPSALAGGPEVSLGTRAANVLGPAIASETGGQITKGTVAEPWARAAGAIFGTPLPTSAAKVISPNVMDATRAANVANLDRNGITALTAGQKTGAQGLRYAESVAADNLFGGGKARAIEGLQNQQFVKAVWQHAGIDADNVRPETVNQAFDTLGKEGDDLANQTAFQMDQQLKTDLNNIRIGYARHGLESKKSGLIKSITDDIFSIPNGVIAGPQYKAIRSEIGQSIRDYKVNNPVLARTLGKVQSALDDAMERASSPELAGQWRDWRLKYRNLLAIAKAASASGEKTANGGLSPTALRNAVKQQGPNQYVRGSRPLGELARSAEGVMKPLANSGTQPRTAASHALSIPAALAGAALGTSAGGPLGAIAGAGMGYFAPALAQGLGGRMLMSAPVQRIAANQAMAKPLAAFEAGQLGSEWNPYLGYLGLLGAKKPPPDATGR